MANPHMIKAQVVDGEFQIDVLAAPYGGPHNGKDKVGQFFDNRTEFHLDKFPAPPLIYYHGFTPDGKMDNSPQYIGEPLKRWVDERGVWIRYALDATKALARKMYDAVDRGIAFVSSGSAPHLVRDNITTGHITEWPILEVSIIDADGDRQPANRYAVAQLAAKTMYKTAGLNYPTTPTEETTSAGITTAYSLNYPKDISPAIPKEPSPAIEDRDGGDPPRKTKPLKGLPQMPYEKIIMEFIENLRAAFADEVKMEDGAEKVDEEALDEAMEEGMKAAKTIAKKDSGVQAASDEDREKFLKAALENHLSDILPAMASKYVAATSRRADAIKSAMSAARQRSDEDAPATSKASGAVHNPEGTVKSAAPKWSAGENMKYARLSAEQMALGYLFAKSKKETEHISPDYMRELAGKAKEFANDGELNNIEERFTLKAMTRYIKADEFNASDIAGQGTEWVSEYWNTVAWDKARDAQIIDQVIAKGMHVHELPNGAGSMKITTIGSDPVVYSAPEANDLDSTNRPEVTAPPQYIGTGNVTVTPGVLKAAVGVTRILSEKSIIDMAAQTSGQLIDKLTESITELFLNGDTVITGSTNLNLIDGTPGTGTARPYYLASDGAMKYAIITGSGTSRNAGVLTIDDPLDTLALFPSTINTRLDDILFVMDASTRFKMLGLAELTTQDVAASFATIQSGRILNLWGVDTYSTGFLPLANAAGKVPGAGGTLGRLLAVYAPYWAMVWARHIDLESDRDILSGTDVFVASARVGFQERGAGAAVASYNITV